MPTNQNKIGTCKCIDYYKKNEKTKYVKQTRTKDGNIIELKCNNKVSNGEHFCEKHKDCKQVLNKFTNNEEPDYEPSIWSPPYIEGSHNCYAYFLDTIFHNLVKQCESLCKKNSTKCPKKISQCRSLIPQPGDDYLMRTENSLRNKSYKYDCKNMERKILNDNPTIFKTELLKKCPKKHYKGSMVVDPGNTFHFYRQNKDGTWSHKPGTLPVTKVDADFLPIYTPFTANRDYSKPNENDNINYTGFCGYYFIPKDKKKKAR